MRARKIGPNHYDKHMAKEEEIIVYWGPCYKVGPEHIIDWNMFYTDPTELLPEIKKQRDKNSGKNSIVYCPAFNDNYKNTFVLRNVVDSSFRWNYEQNVWEIPTKYQIHPAPEIRENYLLNRRAIITSMVWLFVCEESLEMEVIAPYLHPTEASAYGVVGTGKFDIGKWFRPVFAEYMLWEGVDRLRIKEEEPFFYVRFNTDKKVVLKRYQQTEEILKYSISNVETKYVFGKLPALDKLYSYFAKTRTRDIMLKKIKDAVIE